MRAQTAIEKGKFQRSSNGHVDAMSVLAVADDVASAMTFLHAHGVLHGNLCASSVLLAHSQVQTCLARGTAGSLSVTEHSKSSVLPYTVCSRSSVRRPHQLHSARDVVRDEGAWTWQPNMPRQMKAAGAHKHETPSHSCLASHAQGNCRRPLGCASE